MSVDQLKLKALGSKAEEHWVWCKRQHYVGEFWRDSLATYFTGPIRSAASRRSRDLNAKKDAYFI